MFYLSRIEHTLRLPPDLLSLPLEQAIRQELDKLFLDKVVANLGLCVSVGAIKSIEGGFIHAGDGASTYTADFMLVMFRPFVGEVISARLKESDANGLRLTLGFFEDIYIPAYYLPNPSRFEPDSRNKQTGSWTWHYQDADNTIDYPIEGDGEIRFQVNSVKYPSIPVERKPEDTKPFAAMLITLIVLVLLHIRHSEENTRDLSIGKVWVPSVGGYEMGGKSSESLSKDSIV